MEEDKMEVTEPKQIITTTESEETSVTDCLEKMIQQHDIEDGPLVMEVKMVHSMLKKMETQFQDKINDLQQRLSSVERADQGTCERLESDESQVVHTNDEICLQLDKLTLKTKAVSSAIQYTWEDRNQLIERIEKLEMTNVKRMAIISGLYIQGKKYQKMQQIENFFDTELQIRPYIEDFYTLGSSTPPAIVIICQSMRDKTLIMRNKKQLKGLENQDKKPIYINDFIPIKKKEKNKKHKEIYSENQRDQSSEKPKMELINGELYVNSIPYQDQISPPDPASILECTTSELDDIMKIPICKGGEIEQEGIVFTAYTLCTDSIDEVRKAYLKMRLCNPRARHIICAYYIPNKEKYMEKGYCDNKEHAAGLKILKLMVDNNLTHRIVFVTRRYSGKKIGPDRFVCIQRAVTECLETYSLNTVLGFAQEIMSEVEGYDQYTEGDSQDDNDHGSTTQTRRGMPSLRGSYANRLKANPSLQRPEKKCKPSASHPSARQSNPKRKMSPSDDQPQHKNAPRQQTFNPDGSFTKNAKSK